MKPASFARVYAAQPLGITGSIVSVEVDIVRNSLNAFTIIGVPDKAVEESRDRVGTALRNSSLPSPKHANQKTVVSLLPAELRKEGAYYDVAIAIGTLLAGGYIHAEIETSLFLGELSLNGQVQSVRGVLPLVLEARNRGFTTAYVPAANAHEASIVDGITVYAIERLIDLVAHMDHDGYIKLMQDEKIKPDIHELTPVMYNPSTHISTSVYPDMNTIRGQELAKRACEIAAAGGHSIALYGPPGTGKTMLSRAFTGLLPDLTIDESIEVTGIHSVAGTLGNTLLVQPPFRSPHHTSSYVALVGGGSQPRPGEITLAHRGVLFLDEFPEFDLRVLESLRQPLEDKTITVSRARGTIEFPANFTLVAAMNPCPCGFAGSRLKKCSCSEMQLKKYRKKLSGPLVDRIDLWVPVEHVSYEELHTTDKSGESTDSIRNRVLHARNISHRRSVELHIKYPNNMLKAQDMNSIGLSESGKKILMMSAEKMHLSPRSYHRVMRVARTIADLESSISIEDRHILDALQFRPRAPLVDN